MRDLRLPASWAEVEATEADARETHNGFLGICPDTRSDGQPIYRAYVIAGEPIATIDLGEWVEPAHAALMADIGEMLLGRCPQNYRLECLLGASFTPGLADAWEKLRWKIVTTISPVDDGSILDRPNLFKWPSGARATSPEAPSLSRH